MRFCYTTSVTVTATVIISAASVHVAHVIAVATKIMNSVTTEPKIVTITMAATAVVTIAIGYYIHVAVSISLLAGPVSAMTHVIEGCGYSLAHSYTRAL
jgi:hypothetical protein